MQFIKKEKKIVFWAQMEYDDENDRKRGKLLWYAASKALVLLASAAAE